MAELILTIVGLVALAFGLLFLLGTLAVLLEFCRSCGEIEKRDWLE